MRMAPQYKIYKYTYTHTVQYKKHTYSLETLQHIKIEQFFLWDVISLKCGSVQIEKLTVVYAVRWKISMNCPKVITIRKSILDNLVSYSSFTSKCCGFIYCILTPSINTQGTLLFPFSPLVSSSYFTHCVVCNNIMAFLLCSARCVLFVRTKNNRFFFFLVFAFVLPLVRCFITLPKINIVPQILRQKPKCSLYVYVCSHRHVHFNI